jgi:hypothetical protein
MRASGETEIYSHVFLFTALDGINSLDPLLVSFIPEEKVSCIHWKFPEPVWTLLSYSCWESRPLNPLDYQIY